MFTSLSQNRQYFGNSIAKFAFKGNNVAAVSNQGNAISLTIDNNRGRGVDSYSLPLITNTRSNFSIHWGDSFVETINANNATVSSFSWNDTNLTIEFWLYQTQTPGVARAILGTSDGSFDSKTCVIITSDNRIQITRVGLNNISTAANLIPLNTWVHVAIVKSGTTTRIFINGVQRASSTTGVWDSVANESLFIGYMHPNNGSPFRGYLDEIIITRGIAKYTTNFTPPTVSYSQTLENFNNVSLLMYMDSLNDSSPNNYGVFNSGNVIINTNIKKFGSGSAFFNNGPFLQIRDSQVYFHQYTTPSTIQKIDITWPLNSSGLPLRVNNGFNKEKIIAVDLGTNSHIRSFNSIFFGCVNLTTFNAQNILTATDFASAWYDCERLTSFPTVSCPRGTSFSNAWRDCLILSSFSPGSFPAATNFNSTWRNCRRLTVFPDINCPLVTSFSDTWRDCLELRSFRLTSFPQPLSLTNTWYNCNKMPTFPTINIPRATTLSNTWAFCSSLTSWDMEVFPKVQTFNSTWRNCTKLTSFPQLSCPDATTFTNTWLNCTSLTQFNLTSFPPSTTNVSLAWENCSKLTTFPIIECPNVTTIAGAWKGCTSLSSFPVLNLPVCTNFDEAWNGCVSLTSVPNINYPDNGSYSSTWRDCRGLTVFPNIDFSGVNSLINTWNGCTSLVDFLPSSFSPYLENLNGTWANCRALTSFPLYLTLESGYGWLQSTWQSCVSLTEFPGISAPYVSDWWNIWTGCTSLRGFPEINVRNAWWLENTWAGCTSLRDFGPIDSKNVEWFWGTWNDCPNLTGFKFYDDAFTTLNYSYEGPFKNSRLSTHSWSSILTAISATNPNTGVEFNGGFSRRNPAGTQAYNYLTQERGWLIRDYGEDGNKGVFADSSLSAYSAFNGGGVFLSEDIKKFGTGSAYFQGIMDNYLRYPLENLNLDYESSNITLECWIYITADPDTSRGIMGTSFDTFDGKFQVFINPDKSISVERTGEYNTITTPPGVITTNQWHHLAIEKGGVWTAIFVNGIISATSQNDFWENFNSNNFYIGYRPVEPGWWDEYDPTTTFKGYIDEVIITKNTAKFGLTNFTPPTASYAETLENYNNVALLLYMDS